MRVLRLLPGTFDDPISCELITTDLDSPPVYEPISYAWGDDPNRRRIRCHGRPLEINVNLFHALQHFRYENQPRPLWADGICIDQSNEREKGHQVGFMGKIYNRGRCTLVWLGPSDNEELVQRGLQLMTDFNEFAETQDQSGDRSYNPWLFESVFNTHPVISDASRWMDAAKLLSRPWFERAWIAQEVALSRHAVAVWGKTSMTLSKVFQFVIISELAQVDARLDLDSLWPRQPFNILFQIQLAFPLFTAWLAGSSLLYQWGTLIISWKPRACERTLFLLERGRRLLTTDARDHVYAFLGNPELAEIIEADYTLNLEQLHLKLAIQLLQMDPVQPLSFLASLQNSADDLESDRPSWVPQWHKCSGTTYLGDRSPDCWRSHKAKATDLAIYRKKRIEVTGILMRQITRLGKEMVISDWTTKVNAQHPKHLLEDLWSKRLLTLDLSEAASREGWVIFLCTLVLHEYSSTPAYYADFSAYCDRYCTVEFTRYCRGFGQAIDETGKPIEGDAMRFLRVVREACRYNRYFITADGFTGIAPGTTRTGDILAAIRGCGPPLILRRTGIKRCYKVVGPCCSMELLEEGQEEWMTGSTQEQRIILV